ncbi:adenosylcobinamide-GDP ribazoletransferase [Microbulbifer rhizosphaerae]|uniref:Adenosylcobinamide-GDP ribazoletransferase n=1 Tax=Microbulbifer rhizosphaerae TaxID=1562603 RepID=A0A7W4WA86_9GAMM|nr:adenosylcobinamide-GDP ribazoletransferase [Microbulbifer rhizosphaerae]MBB3060543.1 adenosylcobinamide-GDP ribazoletransferase [Microbulbifer rhizosphaerae]
MYIRGKLRAGDKPYVRDQLRRGTEAFFYALMFLTRLPVERFVRSADTEVAARAVYFYPLVGALMGSLLLLSAIILAPLGTWLAAALVVTLWVLLTGALHLDGLADCMDGYYAGHKMADKSARRERILQVMRDPACGAVALVALLLVLLLKVVAVASLWEQDGGQEGSLLAVLLAPLLARTVVLPFMALADYARSEGVVAPAQTAGVQTLWLVALVTCALVSLLLGPLVAGVLFSALALLVLYWWRFWHEQIGGYTGDCLGALVELSELLVLILLVALW